MSNIITSRFNEASISDALQLFLTEGKQKAVLKNSDDDFSDGIRGWQWDALGDQSRVTEGSGVLNINIPAPSGNITAGYDKASVLSGEFDIQIDWANWVSPGGSVVAFGILEFKIDGDNWVYLQRRYDGANRIAGFIKESGTVRFNGNVVTSASSGKFRIVNDAISGISIYYDIGAGWVQMSNHQADSFAVAGTCGVYGFSQATIGTTNIDFDDFIINENGWFPTTAPTIETDLVDFGSSINIPVTDILIPSNTLAADTDIQISLSLNGGAFSSFYNLDSTHANKIYNLKAGQIGGDSVTCSTIQARLKLNSNGADFQELGQIQLDSIAIAAGNGRRPRGRYHNV